MTTYTATVHHHRWEANGTDTVWHCACDGCPAWISLLVDIDGREILLPKDRP